MLARETSTWSLKRRSDEVDEEFGEFEEDKDLDEDFDDELEEDELVVEIVVVEFRPKKGPKREWE